MKRIISLFFIASILCSSCAKFNIQEAAHFSHKCPKKHAKRLHRYGGKMYYSMNENTPYNQTEIEAI